jgi:integrase
MAQTGTNKLRRWEFPAGSGVRIREIINRNAGADHGLSYRVTIPARLAGSRQFRQFSSLDAAEAWAKQENRGIRHDGQKHFLLTASQRDDALSALSILDGTGLSLADAATLAKNQHEPPAGALTVADAIKKLLAEKEAENLRARSVRDLRNRLAVFEQTFGERQLGAITRTEIEEWLRDLHAVSSAAALSARSKKNYLITVRTFFNWGASKGYRTSENPAANISTPKIDWKSPAILTVEEARKLIVAASTEQGGRLLATVALGLFAGIRTNEITRLDWQAIDLGEGIITIGSEIAKKRRLRVLELMPACKKWLARCREKSGRVAPGKFNERWAKLVKKAGFPDWRENRSNAMRHSFGSYHYALHSDAAKTSAMLGHRASDQVLFDSYRSLARKKDAEAYFAIMP